MRNKKTNSFFWLVYPLEAFLDVSSKFRKSEEVSVQSQAVKQKGKGRDAQNDQHKNIVQNDSREIDCVVLKLKYFPKEKESQVLQKTNKKRKKKRKEIP
jgi:hypothetical protein